MRSPRTAVRGLGVPDASIQKGLDTRYDVTAKRSRTTLAQYSCSTIQVSHIATVNKAGMEVHELESSTIRRLAAKLHAFRSAETKARTTDTTDDTDKTA